MTKEIYVRGLDEIVEEIKKIRDEESWELKVYDLNESFIASFDNSDESEKAIIKDDEALRQYVYQMVDCSMQMGMEFDLG